MSSIAQSFHYLTSLFLLNFKEAIRASLKKKNNNYNKRTEIKYNIFILTEQVIHLESHITAIIVLSITQLVD